MRNVDRDPVEQLLPGRGRLGLTVAQQLGHAFLGGILGVLLAGRAPTQEGHQVAVMLPKKGIEAMSVRARLGGRQLWQPEIRRAVTLVGHALNNTPHGTSSRRIMAQNDNGPTSAAAHASGNCLKQCVISIYGHSISGGCLDPNVM